MSIPFDTPTPAGLVCPKCRGQMRTYERQGVHVEQCETCRGLFLDFGELEHLTRMEASVMAPPPPAQAPPAQQPPAPQPYPGQYPPGYPPQPYPSYGPAWGDRGGHRYRRGGLSGLFFSS